MVSTDSSDVTGNADSAAGPRRGIQSWTGTAECSEATETML